MLRALLQGVQEIVRVSVTLMGPAANPSLCRMAWVPVRAQEAHTPAPHVVQIPTAGVGLPPLVQSKQYTSDSCSWVS
jgi:hypothetical protein